MSVTFMTPQNSFPAAVTPSIPASGFEFLTELRDNNNRDWFNARKSRYQEELQAVERFADALLVEMNTHDQLETLTGKESLHRIYRDTRFSSDKTPYKSNWSGAFKRATKYRRGGYYFHIEPGNSFLGGGFWGPNTDDLKRIREEIAFDPARLRGIITDPTFTETFGALMGEQLKTAPKGFDAQHEAIDLLRFKQFLVMKRFSDQEVLNADFVYKASETFRRMRPFFDYMSEILTMDGNGE
jgi:uncharacterized protein (TIGR02453 family)